MSNSERRLYVKGLLESYGEKVRKIAVLSFEQKQLTVQDSEAASKIETELSQLRGEIERLQFYMSLLDPVLEEVLRLFYVEGKIWAEIELITSYSRSSLPNYRDRAINKLVEMYQTAFPE